MDNKGISVVIPNFNGRELLPEILPPLFIALKATQLSYEVIVCDDCSKDDSINYIETKFMSMSELFILFYIIKICEVN